MCEIFVGNTADEAWLKAINKLKTASTHQSRLGKVREILHANFHVKDPRQRWVTSRLPAINPAFAIVEVFWILGGRKDSGLVNYWNPLLSRFAGDGSNYHGAYGYRIRQQQGFDQFERAYLALRNNPNSRQIVIQIWDSPLDFPNEAGLPTAEDIPCNICSMPKIRNGRLEWLQIMRSNDLYRGTPYNIVQFSTLQEILAGWLNVEVGAYHQISDCLHIYEADFEEFSFKSIGTNLTNEDSLALDKDTFDAVLGLILKALERLSTVDLSRSNFRSIIKAESLPKAYKNLLTIAACDSARRRGWLDELELTKSYCTNQLLLMAWKQWEARFPISRDGAK